MSIPMPTRDELLRFAPKAKTKYIDALLAGEEHLRKAGILHHRLSWCHFMAQVSAETNFLTIWDENMSYRSVERIRQVWPARTRKMSEEKLRSLVGNPKALANEMYGSRMGNRKGTDDGYNFRGRGFIQTTGRHAYEKYGRALGISIEPNALDDAHIFLLFACLEWASTGCNSAALENDILKVSKIINTGSATSGVTPNGMEHRRRGLKRAWAVWGDPDRKTVPEASSITKADLKKGGSETLTASDLLKAGGVVGGLASTGAGAASESGIVKTVPNETTQQVIDQIRTNTESVNVVSDFVTSIKSFWLLISTNLWMMGFILAVLAYWIGRKIDWRRLLDARQGWNLGRLGEIQPIDPELVDDPDLAVIPRA
jgi:putative chitinase